MPAAGLAALACQARPLRLPPAARRPPLGAERRASWRRRRGRTTGQVAAPDRCTTSSHRSLLNCQAPPQAQSSRQTLLRLAQRPLQPSRPEGSAANIGCHSSSRARGEKARVAAVASAAVAAVALLAATACALFLLRPPPASGSMVWRQHEITLPAFKRGAHLVGAACCCPALEASTARARCRLPPALDLAAARLPCPLPHLRRAQVTQHVSGEIASSLRDIKIGLAHVFSECLRCCRPLCGERSATAGRQGRGKKSAGSTRVCEPM